MGSGNKRVGGAGWRSEAGEEARMLTGFRGRVGRGVRGGRDVLVAALVLGGLWSVLRWGREACALPDSGGLDLALRRIPEYASYTVLRMGVAFLASLAVGVGLGLWAAKSTRWRGVLLSVLDLLQSIPVLGFLSLTAAFFLALSPRSRIGAECACVFAIFTSQVWNLAFAFYQSWTGIPADLQEVATACGLSGWQRFFTVELPASFGSLLWNGMLSFGCGWFFVAQCETLSLLQTRVQLPGLGSFVTEALERDKPAAAAAGLFGILCIVVAFDQVLWRPLLVWADKFRIELTESESPPRSWFYRWLAHAPGVLWVDARILSPMILRVRSWRGRSLSRAGRGGDSRCGRGWGGFLAGVGKGLGKILVLGAGLFVLRGVGEAGVRVGERLDGQAWSVLFWGGLCTLGRVAAATALASLLWIPAGIGIARAPCLCRLAEPAAQMAAAFPINLIFPWMMAALASRPGGTGSMEWGSVILMTLASQWYVLFNVLAGLSALPYDLEEAARVYRLRGWKCWRVFYLPAIFPYWITGACTAAGGAWNASIVAEFVSWGPTTLRATGLGALMVDASQRGDMPVLWASIALMALLVVATNRLVWRPLYSLAERRFHLD